MTAGAGTPPSEVAAPAWRVLTTSALGASHTAVGLPNQDAVGSRQIGAEAVVVAVADGHGHQRHFRSAAGSALAVRIGCDAAAELAAQLDGTNSASEIEDAIRSALIPAVVSRWRAAVLEDLAADPFTTAEQAARGLGDSDLIAYGATLLLALAWRRWLLLAQIGDGDIVGIQPDGRPLQPVPGDPALDGNQTTSLCGSQPERDFRVAAVDTGRRPLLALLIATDGYGNAQLADPWVTAVSADLAEMIGDRGPDWIGQQLPAWAARCASADGSGDDTTVALMLAPGAAQARQRAKLAMPPVSPVRRLTRSIPTTLRGPLADRSGPDGDVPGTEPDPAAEATALPAWPGQYASAIPAPLGRPRRAGRRAGPIRSRRVVLAAVAAVIVAAGVITAVLAVSSGSGSPPTSPAPCASPSHSSGAGAPARPCRSAADSPGGHPSRSATGPVLPRSPDGRLS